MTVGIPEQHGQPQQLWEHFVVVGLPGTGLQTVQGEPGFLGTDQKYKPAFVDSLPQSNFDETCRLPPQLPTCCLPAGIDIVLYQDLHKADLTPHTFACVLTEGDGTKVYASCLTFYDRAPSDLCAKHEDLLGAVALKAMCLLSRQPYLASSQQVLRELYHCAFQRGSSIPVPDLIHSLLAVPCPPQGGPKLCLRLSSSQRVVCPPLPIGPPPGEVSLQPLLEVMQPDSLVGLFAAVLLEQRVLLRSRQHWLLTVVAEGVVRLLYPLKYQHVYIPVMPCSLADYLEAPTPFLMGLHSAEPVDQRLLDMLVVADLDSGALHLGKDDGLLRHCLSHPYMHRLERRVRMLMQPSVTEADVVSSSTEQYDPWVAAARALGPGAPWSPCKQALLLRVFMEFFHEVLRDHQLFLSTSSAGAADGRSSMSRRDSRLTSGGGSAAGGSSGGAAAGVRALRSALSLSGAAGAAGTALQAGRNSSLAPGPGMLLQAHCRVGMQALLDHHFSICRHKDASLLQQVMQGLPFLCFVGEHSSAQDPLAWLKAGETTLAAWRAAEEELWTAQHADGQALAGRGVGQLKEPSQWPLGQQAGGSNKAADRQQNIQDDFFPGIVVCIPDQPPSALMPRQGYLHQTFPHLILSEYSERAQGLKRRKAAVSRQTRPSVGRRRAISELMGSPLDMRRKSPLPAGTNTDTSPPRLNRINPLDMPVGSSGTVPQLQGALTLLAPGLPMPNLAKISNASTNASLSEEYSAEAELIGRQMGMLVHLMQAAAAAAAAAASSGCAASNEGAAASSSSCSNTDGAGGFLFNNQRSSIAAGGAGPAGLLRRNSLGGASAAAVLRRFSSNGARSNRVPADVLEAARQLLCIQTGGNGWFLVSRLKELVANPPAPSSEGGCLTVAGTRPGSSNNGTRASTAAAAATAGAGDKKAAASSGSKSPPPQAKNMLAKSGKILGVNLSGSSSSSSKPSGLAGLKVGHGVESFANAASAMASVISRNASATKQKHASGHSNSNSPTHTADSSKVTSSAPSSTCGSAAISSGAAAPPLHSASCRHLEHKERAAAPAAVASDGGADTSAGQPAAEGGEEAAGPSSNMQRAAGANSEAAAGDGILHRDGGNSSGEAMADASAGECPVPPDVFDVLSDMLNAVIEVAVAQDDSRVALTVLELARLITCTAGGTKHYLLSRLAGNPAMHTEWFWASTFGFAVSSSYLNADEFVNVRVVITRCLQQFATYLAGVGIPGAASWVLLMQMASEHLQMAHMEPLEPGSQLVIRRQLAHAKAQFNTSSSSSPEAAAPVARLPGMDAAGNSNISSSPQPAAAQGVAEGADAGEQQGALPQHVAAALNACGISLPSEQPKASAASALAEPRGGSKDGSNSDGWHVDAPRGGMVAASHGSGNNPGCCKTAVTIPAPGTADAELIAAGGSIGSRVVPSPGFAAAAASARVSDAEGSLSAAVVQRPLSPLGPAGALHSMPSASSLQQQPSSPLGLTTPRGGNSNSNSSSPKAVATRVKEHGSYAKLLNRQATNSLGNSPTAAAAFAAAAAAADAGCASAVAAADAEASAAAPAVPAVQGGCLTDQGALQWAPVHTKAVVAVAASSYTAVTAGRDGYMRVLDLSGGTMRLAASMQIPSLLQHDGAAAAAAETLPVLQLWHDGQRAAVGNARHQAVWIVDLVGGKPSLELTGLGSSVSCLFPLYRNRDALLSGITHGGVPCNRGNGAGTSQVAAAYLWDLRRPKKPASSLNYEPETRTASVPVATTAAATAAAGSADLAEAAASPRAASSPRSRAPAGGLGVPAGVPGILCLSVHEDGALAAAGFRDGKVLTWDMRQPGTPLSECRGHTGPVQHVSFLPAAASAAAGLGRVPLLLTGSEDWTARLWDAETGSCRGACIGHGGAVTAMQTVHSNAATRFVTGAADGSIGVWGLDGDLFSLVQQYEKPVMLLRQGGDTLVSGAADKACHVWGMQHILPGANSSSNGCSSVTQPSHLLASQCKPAAVGAMAFDPVAELLCAGHSDGVVSIWNCCYSTTQCGTIFE